MSKPRSIPNPLQILIVEDVDAMRELLDLTLREIPGIKVSGAVSNTFEARVELTRRRPHLVLLDEILPGESSLDFLAEVKALEIPVLLITSIVGRTHALADGAVGRMVKPTWNTLDEDRVRIQKTLFDLATTLFA
ncbi:MAG: response regulator [Methylotenera sp.]|nr:response regulator [Oligoflexia bacterium]